MLDLFNQSSSYYNTNKENGNVFLESKAKAENQEQEIKNIFLKTNVAGFTADELHRHQSLKAYPITSIRRALTNLCGEKWGNFLVKTDTMRMGNFGKQTHVYKIRAEYIEKDKK
jgi:hypothetical protein